MSSPTYTPGQEPEEWVPDRPLAGCPLAEALRCGLHYLPEAERAVALQALEWAANEDFQIALLCRESLANARATLRLEDKAPEMAGLLQRQHALLVARRDEVARSLEGLALRAQFVPADLLAPLSDHYRQLVEITAEAESLLEQVEGSK